MEHDLSLGLGLQVIDVDLTGSDEALMNSAASISAYIFYDDTETFLNTVEATWTLGTAIPTTNDPAVYRVDVTEFGTTTTRTYFRVPVTFAERGTYLISLRITDTNNDFTSSVGAISVGVGDGLPRSKS